LLENKYIPGKLKKKGGKREEEEEAGI